MKGQWVYDGQADIWHLTWHSQWDPTDKVMTWCHKDYPLDAPIKDGSQINGLQDTLHDECVRKAEELSA